MNSVLARRITPPLLAVVAAAGILLPFSRELIDWAWRSGAPGAAQNLTPSEGRSSWAPADSAVSTPSRLATAERVLKFDVARVEPNGESVIAGRASPGANVELLRDGDVHSRIRADASGEFVMVPPRLPMGTYHLSLRSKQPDGTELSSGQTVIVSLAPRLEEVETSSAGVLARTEAPLNVPVPRAAMKAATPPGQTEVAPVRTMSAEQGAALSNVVASKLATATVARGDSLWRISRNNYGVGEKYPSIFGANRRRIHNPDLIYPGQILVLPTR
jgi:LysM repeat protein